MTTAPAMEAQAEAYRPELIGYCYRFFASYAEAEDAVQETMLRAWQHAGKFEERSSLRRWLYAIATNICLDMSRARQRRSLPMDLTAPGRAPEDPTALATRPEATWVGPLADTYLASDPAETSVRRDSVRLAFVTALQLLPPRQRVVLILRDVLAWTARECAELLGVTVASVNSALARARTTVGERTPGPGADYDEVLLGKYMAAFEAYDVDRLVSLLAEDATFSMPPFELWLRGSEQIEQWWRGPGQVCRNSRTLLTGANAQPALAVYHDVGGHRWEPFALQVLEMGGDRITDLTHFMGPAVFREFGLPAEVTEPAQ